MILVSENQPLSELYFVVDGIVMIKKGDNEFQLTPGNFIGEIAFVLDRLPTADVAAQQGARLIKWDASQITQLMKKSPAFQNAIMALLGRNLADKLAKSIQVDNVTENIPAI